MLIHEEKGDDFRICYFDSSNILMSKYVPSKKKLAIIFKGGTQYVYDEITNYEFQRFKVSKSQGKRFNSHIKNKFQTTKVEGKVNVQPILEIIKEIKGEN